MDDSTTGQYDMIIGRDLLTNLGIYLKVYKNSIDCGEGTYQGCTSPMINLDNYDSELVNRKMRPFLYESFLNAYVNECHESETVFTATKRVQTIPNAKNEKAYLYQKINKHYKNLTFTKKEELLTLINKKKVCYMEV